jgi:hypothetical protein
VRRVQEALRAKGETPRLSFSSSHCEIRPIQIFAGSSCSRRRRAGWRTVTRFPAWAAVAEGASSAAATEAGSACTTTGLRVSRSACLRNEADRQPLRGPFPPQIAPGLKALAGLPVRRRHLHRPKQFFREVSESEQPDSQGCGNTIRPSQVGSDGTDRRVTAGSDWP